MYGKTVRQSRVIVSQVMQPSDANPAGNVHGGTIMKLIDNVIDCFRAEGIAIFLVDVFFIAVDAVGVALVGGRNENSGQPHEAQAVQNLALHDAQGLDEQTPLHQVDKREKGTSQREAEQNAFEPFYWTCHFILFSRERTPV